MLGAHYQFDMDHDHSGEVDCAGKTSIHCQWAYYLEYNPHVSGGIWTVVLQKTGTWILIFTNFVPISLMVTLEIVKLW
tara:strand:- start:156 stop:389 length:234 start_codon:yes stop_codon:yes gene_type:complete